MGTARGRHTLLVAASVALIGVDAQTRVASRRRNALDVAGAEGLDAVLALARLLLGVKGLTLVEVVEGVQGPGGGSGRDGEGRGGHDEDGSAHVDGVVCCVVAVGVANGIVQGKAGKASKQAKRMWCGLRKTGKTGTMATLRGRVTTARQDRKRGEGGQQREGSWTYNPFPCM